jgi:hypothetical protein
MGDPGDQGKPGDRQGKRGSGGGPQPGAGRHKTTLDRITPDQLDGPREDGYMWATQAIARFEGYDSPEAWVKATWQEHIDALKTQRGEYWEKVKARWIAHLQDELDRNRLTVKKKTGKKGKLDR